MNDHIFNQLCETYGMAPTKPLRDLVESAVKQEREAIIKFAEDDRYSHQHVHTFVNYIKARSSK